MDAKILQAESPGADPPHLGRIARRRGAGHRQGLAQGEEGFLGQYALEVIRDNIIMAKDKSQPLCQDTGTIICYADLPAWCDEATFRKAYEKAVVQATKVGYLRQNSVDSITGKNSGNNLGPGSPVLPFPPGQGQGPEGADDAQGRRLRERRAPSTACRTTGSAPAAISKACAVPPGRGAPGPGQGLRPGHPGGLHRRRPGFGLRGRQGNPFPDAGRQERGQACWPSWKSRS